MRTRKHPADARLWSYIADELRQVSGASFEEDHRLARRIVAHVRRERGDGETWAGNYIPHGVTEVYDLDGDVWERHGGVWKMRDFDPEEVEAAAGGAYVTEALLEQYGPLTELPKRGRHA